MYGDLEHKNQSKRRPERTLGRTLDHESRQYLYICRSMWIKNAEMLAVERSAGVTPAMNLSQKSKTGIPVTPQKSTYVLPKTVKEILNSEFQTCRFHAFIGEQQTYN